MKNKMLKFIAFSSQGDDISGGVQPAEVIASSMLDYDGFEYFIWKENGEFKLFVSRGSRHGYGGTRGFAEWPSYAASTKSGVFESVIKKGGVQDTYALSEADYNEIREVPK
jgi:hypothetical protein